MTLVLGRMQWQFEEHYYQINRHASAKARDLSRRNVFTWRRRAIITTLAIVESLHHTRLDATSWQAASH